jgi:hypothetical protein
MRAPNFECAHALLSHQLNRSLDGEVLTEQLIKVFRRQTQHLAVTQ